jgi:hypothetical protein
MAECTRRFRARVGRAWGAADLERIDAALTRETGDEIVHRAMQTIAAEVQRMERLPHAPAIAGELRNVLERYAPQSDQGTRMRFEKRSALVYELDEPSFLGTGTEATDADLAVVSILCGIGLPDPAQRKKKTAAGLIAEEARTIRKVRAQWGVPSTRGAAKRGG